MAEQNPSPLQDPLASNASEVRYWRSLQEREDLLAQKPARDEFAPGAAQPPKTVDRRSFLGILGATAALAGAVACDRTKGRGHAVPYTRRPPEAGIPGVAMYYASSFQEGRRAYSVLVKTREGRPIHITGNDEHPAKAATSPRAIAEVLGLYDPDRLRAPQVEGRNLGWTEAETSLLQGLRSAGTKPILLLTGAQTSPTRLSLVQELKSALPTLEHVAWEPSLGGQEAASRKVLGGSFQPVPNLAESDLILSLGADFLNGEDPVAIQAFTRRRLPQSGKPVNRLWVLESALSLTGSRADQRLPVAPSHLAGIAFALAKALGAKGLDLPDLPSEAHLPADAWKALIRDLGHAGSKALVLAGDQAPAEVHAAAALLNATLKSAVLRYRATQPIATTEELQALEQKLEAGTYGAVLIWGANPAYAWPRAEAFRRALAKVPFKAFLGTHLDETAVLCPLRLAESHWLESWGDHADGQVLALQQPVIAPLYDTQQGEEVLLSLLRGLGRQVPADARQHLKARLELDLRPAGNFETFFQQALHDGLIPQPATLVEPNLSLAALGELAKPPTKTKTEGLELVLHPSRTIFDGRHANNSWLQELPDPVTKGTWGNPLSVSVQEARALGLKDGDRVELSLGDRSLKLPVVVQPGQAKGTLALALGYGRTSGNVGGGIGVNAYPLLEGFSFQQGGARIAKLRGHLDLPVTQGHHRLEGRDLVKSITLAQLARMPDKSEHELPTLYPPHENGEHRWGMVIDTASCVGCSACVLACQSENNTPVVGPEQVSKGREMHWIRIDRYYEGDEANPGVVHQPMMCQQCGHAPCENVCPVNATTHSPDGLNQMTYNRCVGTRYCANNCPYKVRRFNFLEFTAYKKEPESLAYNPEVTVRPRGVMEKCTFCVQRIQDGRLRAKGENRPLRDGEIQPACAVSCPSQAITFGDLKDPNSRVSQMARSGRGYQVLDELGVRPAITYLADFRNPALGSSIKGDGHES